MSDVELVVSDDPVRLAAERLAAAVRRGGHIALSGGSTPRPAYELAATLEPSWGRVHVWLGDERLVPPDDPRANVRLVREVVGGLDQPPIVHPVETALPPPEAAAAYDAALADVQLELAFQGLGAGRTYGVALSRRAVARRAERASDRRSGGARAVGRPRDDDRPVPLRGARGGLSSSLGEEKAAAARRAFGEPPSPATPGSLVRSATGRTVAILDRSAARELST